MHKPNRYDYPVNSFTVGSFTDLLQFKLPDAKCFKSDPFSQSNVCYQAYHSDALVSISYSSTLCDEVLLKDFMTIDHQVNSSPLSLLDDLVTLVSGIPDKLTSYFAYSGFNLLDYFVDDDTSFPNQKQGATETNHDGFDSVLESNLLPCVSSLDQSTCSLFHYEGLSHGPGTVHIRYSNPCSETYIPDLTESSGHESCADTFNLISIFQYSLNVGLELNTKIEQVDLKAISRSLAKPNSMRNHPDLWVFSTKMEGI
jgi:hypothetical protein